ITRLRHAGTVDQVSTRTPLCWTQPSGIVHGGNRGESTQYGKLIEMRQQLSTWMKRAIGEAIEELIENPEALDWEQRLDRHIDSLA
ncbi:hypothetical protein, partial [Mycobacteroides abscessus]|uniref:hypothetical protein n=1 Tax=Mycobacteroides abscessus TaxID=36809 RepID=UPI001A96B168